jgi:type IV pilus assembly protein PilQ
MNKWTYIFLFLTSISLAIASDDPAKVKSINFIQDGEVSKLIVDFDKEVFAERTHIKDDKQIILDLKNVIADKKFLRGIDTSEFSGSAVFVSPYKKPGSKNDLRLAIQLRDNVRSFIEKKRNRIVLHLENRFGVFSKKKLDKSDVQLSSTTNSTNEKLNIPKSASIEDILENLTLSGVKRYIGKKISINVIGVNYPALLRMIADTSGFNIIIDDDINGLRPLTLSLTNIPWDQALDTILSLGNLVGEKHSNILTIKTAVKARAEKKIELDQRNMNRIQEPMVTKIFPLSFATPAGIVEIIGDYLTGAAIGGVVAGGQNVEQVGTARIDTRTNNLIVRDTVEVIERIKKIIETLDTETPQILIQSKIVEVSESYELRAGLGAGGLSASYDPIQAASTIGDNSGTFSFSSAPTRGAPNIISGSIDIYKRLTGLNFSLELMESESKGRIVSSPKIITQNNQAATISTEDVRYFLVNPPAQPGGILQPPTLQSVPTGINMTVTPRVTNDGSIAMDLAIQKGSFQPQSDPSQPPPTSTSNIATKVLVDNGSTIVVGGMFSTNNAVSESGIPFLKDLPLVGWLFRTSYNPNTAKTELVVFITPRVINQEEAGLVNRETEDLGI